MTEPRTDWVDWHGPYDDPSSPLTRRLRIIQAHLRDWLASTEDRPVRVLSLCAGDGRDLIEVLSARADRTRISAVLVEFDTILAARAQQSAAAAGLDHVVARHADAGNPTLYADAVGADLILLAGVFGNISDADVRATIRALPMLCSRGARVVWTRHRNEPDLTGSIRAWFAQEGFRERSFTAPTEARFSVGVHDFTGTPLPWAPPTRLFMFFR